MLHYMLHTFTLINYNIHSLWIWCLQCNTFNRSWDRGMFTLKCLGAEDTNREGEILSHSCFIYDFCCSTVRVLHCCIWCFIMRHTMVYSGCLRGRGKKIQREPAVCGSTIAQNVGLDLWWNGYKWFRCSDQLFIDNGFLKCSWAHVL